MLDQARFREAFKSTIEVLTLPCPEPKALVAAKASLDEILATDPHQADALQLLGLIFVALDRKFDAEAMYRRSLAAQPNQAHVHHNLGNVLLSMGRREEAIAAQREALRLNRNYVAAHINLALALSENGELREAEKSYRTALHCDPGSLVARQGLCAVLNDLSRPRDAEIVARQALAMKPDDRRLVAAFEHNLGVSLKLQRRYDEALRKFASAKSRIPDLPSVDFNLATVLQHLGRLDEAVDAYRDAISRSPLDFAAHRDLNSLLYRLGRDSELLCSYDDVLQLYPESGDLYLAKAGFLFQQNKFALARETYEIAAKLLPDRIAAHDGLGMSLARLGEFGESIREHETVARLDPTNAQGWRNFSESLIRAGDCVLALKAAEKALSIDPDHQGSIAIYMTILELLGDARVDELNDCDTLVQSFELSAPDGYSDIGEFNRALDAYLDRLHTDRREALDQSLRTGTQTLDNLFGTGQAIFESLRAQIDSAVRLYITRMKDSSTHPLFRRKSDKFLYPASWSARLHDCGYHINHYHPLGWISSAYYVSVPDAVEDPAARQGWLKFGEPYFDVGLRTPIRKTIKPVAGTLVLFPSYMWHGTIPFHSSQTRTSVAFDVVPGRR